MLQKWRKMMMNDSKLLYGFLGTAVSATGASLSVTELQAIISIIITIAGFIISVLIPLVIKLVKWYKKAKKDGKIDEEELDELGQIVNQGAKDIKDGVESSKKEVSEKSEGE